MSTLIWPILGLGVFGTLELLLYWLYRRPRRAREEPPRRGGGGGFVAIQEIIEPRAHHVLVTQDEPLHTREDDAGSPPQGPGRVDFRLAKERRKLGS